MEHEREESGAFRYEKAYLRAGPGPPQEEGRAHAVAPAGEAPKRQSSLLVSIRCRPLLKHEIKANHYEIIRVLDGKLVILMDPIDFEGTEDVLRINRSKEKHYAFDHAFDQKTATEEIFECTTKKLLPDIVEGFNATCFAYGPTGAGKTYTMLGTLDNPGIYTLTIRKLFDSIREHGGERNYSIKFSYLEIYNEMIRDLLGEDMNEFLDLREDPVKGLVVAGLSEHVAESADQVMKFLFTGKRTQESTGANEVSSRSHAVFQITVERTTGKRDEVDENAQIGKLSLIDLAGSERAAHTSNRGMRMIEGANINRSLLALGNCITKLSDQITKGMRQYIPYRDSKLTRLLKDSLGGNCQTVMIANVSPSNVSYEDTHNTLKYANRAKNIKTTLSKNKATAQHHIAQYTQIITQLKQEVATLRKQVVIARSTSGRLAAASGDIEDDIAKLLDAINEHFADEGNVRKSLYKIRQKIETLSLAILVKKSQYETLSSESAGERLLKEISQNEIQLRQLLTNEEVLVNRVGELGRTREVIHRNILHKQMLAERWVNLLSASVSHSKSVMLAIPAEGDIMGKEAEEMQEIQKSVISRLREQLFVRDDLISRATSALASKSSDLHEPGKGHAGRMMNFQEILRAVEEERRNARPAQLPQLPQLPQLHPPPALQTLNPNEKLFTRVSRFKLPRAQQRAYPVQLEQPPAKQPSKRDEKRSFSVISQNTSFSTGASSGSGLANKLVLNNLGARQDLKIGSRKLQNAGAQIAASVQPRKYKVLRDPNPLLLPIREKSQFKL